MKINPIEYIALTADGLVLAKGHNFVAMDNGARELAMVRNAPVYMATVNKVYVPEPAVKVVNLEDAK